MTRGGHRTTTPDLSQAHMIRAGNRVTPLKGHLRSLTRDYSSPRYVSLWEILLSEYPYQWRRNTPPHLALYDRHYHPPVVLSPRTHSSLRSFLSHISTISFMSQSSSSSSFQALLNAALQDNENQTGTSLVDNPFAKQFREFDSVNSNTDILLSQALIFCEFRADGKLTKSITSSVDVLCLPLLQ